MKRSSISKLSLSRKSSDSVSNQCRRSRKTTNNDVQELEQLSTKEFDSYISNLWKRIPIERRFSCTCVDSLWFTAYVDDKNSKEKVVRRWMSKKKIFTKRYVFVPICLENHWNLLILCNLGEALNSNTKSPCILLLDSLQKLKLGLEPTIRKFLLDLYANEKPEVSEESIYNIPLKMPNVPQQQDGIRCGYYVLYYIYRFLMSCPDDFNISEHYPGFLKKDWFSLNEFDSFFENLPSLRNETGDAFNEKIEIEKVDDLKVNAGMEVEEVDDPAKVENEIEIDKDADDRKSKRKDIEDELDKNEENQMSLQEEYDNNVENSESPKRRNQKTVQKLDRVCNTSPLSVSDTVEPPSKRSSTKKDCGSAHLPFSINSLMSCLKTSSTDHWNCSICQKSRVGSDAQN